MYVPFRSAFQRHNYYREQHGVPALQWNWYSEIRDYEFADPELSEDNAHFTQVVWKRTVGVGCGIADDCEGNMRLVVCRYFPPGNDRGALGANVPSPGDPGF